jgi:hypothetical protein
MPFCCNFDCGQRRKNFKPRSNTEEEKDYLSRSAQGHGVREDILFLLSRIVSTKNPEINGEISNNSSV